MKLKKEFMFRLAFVFIFLSLITFSAEKFDLQKIKKDIAAKGEECRGCLVHKIKDKKLYLVNESTENRSLGIGFLTIYLVDKDNNILNSERIGIELEVENHWLTDLDKDGSKEIVFVSYSIGSGHYANLYVFTVKNDSLIKRKMPSYEVDGYSGHEQVKVKNGNLYINYPLYNKNDSNANPTGGHMELKFDVKKKLWKDKQGTYIKK